MLHVPTHDDVDDHILTNDKVFYLHLYYFPVYFKSRCIQFIEAKTKKRL